MHSFSFYVRIFEFYFWRLNISVYSLNTNVFKFPNKPGPVLSDRETSVKDIDIFLKNIQSDGKIDKYQAINDNQCENYSNREYGIMEGWIRDFHTRSGELGRFLRERVDLWRVGKSWLGRDNVGKSKLGILREEKNIYKGREVIIVMSLDIHNSTTWDWQS